MGCTQSRPDSGENAMDLFLQLPRIVHKTLCREWLYRREAVRAEKEFRTHRGGTLFQEQKIQYVFQPYLAQTAAAYAVLSANADQVIQIVAINPKWFFRKVPFVRGPDDETVYEDVSAADLIVFLCDAVMQQRLIASLNDMSARKRALFIRLWDDFAETQWQKQGGPDVMSVDRDPGGLNFKQFLQFYHTESISSGTVYLSYPLIQNPDALIYFRNPQGKVTWYRVEIETHARWQVTIDPEALAEHAEEYALLLDRMEEMKPMSARRSSDAEWLLFQQIMRYGDEKKPVTLWREGVRYTRLEIPSACIFASFTRQEFLELRYIFWIPKDRLIRYVTENNYQTTRFNLVEIAVLQKYWPASLMHLKKQIRFPDARPVAYQDTVYDFNRYFNAYSKCLLYRGYYPEWSIFWHSTYRLHERIANAIFRHYLGRVQKEVSWLLQSLCEPLQLFDPQNTLGNEFPVQRTFELEGENKPVVYSRKTGKFMNHFGTKLTLFKGAGLKAEAAGNIRALEDRGTQAVLTADLVSLSDQIFNAKKITANFDPVFFPEEAVNKEAVNKKAVNKDAVNEEAVNNESVDDAPKKKA